jgi:cytochrome P450
MNDPALDDLLSDEAINNPASYYAKLRNISPVYWNPRWNGWIVTGHEAVTQGYRDWKRLSSDRFSGPFGGEVRAGVDEQSQLFNFLTKFFVWKDPPYHTRLRALVGAAFAPRRVEALRPRIRELIRELAEPLRGREKVDFFGEFSFQLPVIVIAEYLGVPPEARNEVREWSEDLSAVVFVRGGDSDRMQRGDAAMRKLVDFLRPILREREKNPRDDLISGMITAEQDGTRLSEDEITAAAVLMVFAGHETTMNFLANGVVAFDKFSDQWQRLRGNAELVRPAAEEILRYLRLSRRRIGCSSSNMPPIVIPQHSQPRMSWTSDGGRISTRPSARASTPVLARRWRVWRHKRYFPTLRSSSSVSRFSTANLNTIRRWSRVA